ncbi:DUF2946 family protein [Methylovirgula sp. 4M-Z18]|uniref:DUF2946 family protein n=1 Tax=Methylovirgula sp. 4M-Z18 TaxID=2293567 RepID=UPI000E2ED45B|nr:DUF2946 family protein [Methylovirgula sp. 4M-Z18]RFB78228.1 hypothetical protein DYH55_17830 [Methylovirgula sp. 4M-Z18]
MQRMRSDWRAQMRCAPRSIALALAALALLAQVLLPVHIVTPARADGVPREILALSAALGQDVPLCLHVSDAAPDQPGQAPGPVHRHDDCPFCQSLTHLAGTVPPAGHIAPPREFVRAAAPMPPAYDLPRPAPIQRSARSRAPPILI